MVPPIEKSTFNLIRKEYLTGHIHLGNLGAKLNLSKNTMTKYVKECKEIERLYPKKLNNFNFRLPKVKREYQTTLRNIELINLLPRLFAETKTQKIYGETLWSDYRAIVTTGYSLTAFEHNFIAWKRKNNFCSYSHRKVNQINEDDKAILVKWKNGFDHKKWERATSILDSFSGRPLFDIAKQLERSHVVVLKWIENYKESGIEGLVDAPYTTNLGLLEKVQQKQDRLIALLHQTPAIHGINRASWRLIDLSTIYKQIYNAPMSGSTVQVLLSKAGFGFRRSREVLTSPDPLFREKLDHIKNILSNLGENERFFSVDEYGHFSVNVKGGRSYTKKNCPRLVSTSQKSQGWLIVTAALELSTNQVTHFYSLFKNTKEMIKLLDVLSMQYKGCSKLYFSWDAASWHASKELTKRLAIVNSAEYRAENHTPEIGLAPLPASAQFLNIIESVFSGLAKAVIHNSDYQSIDECRIAIDRHFKERNEFFLLHPKKAGKMIWGMEEVKPVFNEANNCKKPPGKVRPISR